MTKLITHSFHYSLARIGSAEQGSDDQPGLGAGRDAEFGQPRFQQGRGPPDASGRPTAARSRIILTYSPTEPSEKVGDVQASTTCGSRGAFGAGQRPEDRFRGQAA